MNRLQFLTLGLLTILVTDGAEAAPFSVAASVPSTRAWVRRDVAQPPERIFGTMGYDSRRGKVVLFGGQRLAAALGDTWEWDGLSWKQLSPSSSPSARFKSQMTYDEVRGRFVLFGGETSGGELNDTWEWTGTNWEQKSPATQPSVRAHHDMTYDPRRGIIVLFGGQAGASVLQDTWEYDGTSWVEQFPVTSPGQRRRHTMAYDGVNGKVLFFGGLNGAGASQNDTWEWNGANWAQRTPSSSPTARFGTRMVYQPGRSVLALFGGNDGADRDDTWEWDGTTWTQRVIATKPSVRSEHVMAFDIARQKAFLFGGGSGTQFRDSWEYDGTVWKPVSNAVTSPPGLIDPGVAYDSSRGRTVIFGGKNGGSPSSEVYEWDGAQWTQPNPSTKPPTRFIFSMGYDSTRSRTVIYGGEGSGGTDLSDIWEWDGTTWTDTSPSSGPTPSVGDRHSWAYSPALDRFVLFGGFLDAGSIRYDQTWHWNPGSRTWAQQTPSSVPAARNQAKMTNDSIRNRIVMFGGNGTAAALNDTWEWDGSDWLQRFSTTAPAAFPPPDGSSAYDSARQRTVHFTGLTGTGETWEFNGSAGQWTQLSLSTNPPGRDGSSLAYDSLRSRVVLFGHNTTNDTWELPSNTPPTITASYSPSYPNPGSLVSLSSMASDPDGLTVTYKWIQLAGPNVTINNGTGASASFTPPVTGDYAFEVVAADLGGASAYAVTTIKVTSLGDVFDATVAVPSQRKWIRRDVANAPARSGNVIFAEPAYGRVTLFGGIGASEVLSDTWSWDGFEWKNLTGPSAPRKRAGGAAAYDAGRQKGVLFGGNDAQFLEDTWEWNGSSWTQKFPSSFPSNRYGSAMAYDAVRQRVMLFGGNGTNPISDTWVWDGVNWKQLSPASSPPARDTAGMAFDSARDRMILFGGSGAGSTYLGDHWEFDGTSWSQRSLAPIPAARSGHGLAYDAVRGVTVLFGGNASGTLSNQTWEFDGTTWMQKSPATSPEARTTTMAYDPVRRVVVLMGGNDLGSGRFDDTWEWDGTNWRRVAFAELSTGSGTLPGVRRRFDMAFDPVRKETVLLGGFATCCGSPYDDTWVWDGAAWTQRSVGTHPVLRDGHRMEWFPPSSQVLLFGGRENVGSNQNQTWSWDGNAWTHLSPTSSPSVRSDHDLAFDTSRNVMVLFGGGDGSFNNQTWEYDGASWTNRTPASNNPAARAAHRLAYDSQRNRTVLFGGNTGSLANDTWEWNGTAWTQLSPATSPPAQEHFQMVYDPVRRKTLLLPGAGGQGRYWEWDGINWTEIGFAVSAGGRQTADAVFDSIRKRIVVFGGRVNTEMNDTWELPSTTAPSVSASSSPTQPLAGSTITMSANSADPDGDTLDFRWVQLHGPLVTLTGASTDRASFTPTSAGRYGFLLSVSDGKGGYAGTIHNVTVTQTAGTAAGAGVSNPAARAWIRRDSSLPPARYSHEISYDQARGQTVLFGGNTGSSSLGDTWTYNGFQWSQRSPASTPETRELHSLSYDAARQRLVLFGGFGGGTPDYLSTTWEWNGTNWTLRTPSSTPVKRYQAAMGYDPVRQYTLLFGGHNGSDLSDTWVWNGTNWLQKSPASSPSARLGSELAFDPVQGKMLLFGGRAGGSRVDETWTWDGTNWTRLFPGSRPTGRENPFVATDLARGRILLYGGFDGTSALSDTWEWTGSNWVQLTPATSPGARGNSSLTYDLARQRIVIFGGDLAGPAQQDTWEWDGANWQLVSATVTSPSARNAHRLSFDSTRGKTVLFGGNSGGGETWEWNGVAWSQKSPATAPASRQNQYMAYDSLRQETVLFGGQSGASFGDTWTWNGTNWTEEFPTTSPSPRRNGGFAFDSINGVSVLFGGADGSDFNDTWLWDGTNWALRTPLTMPAARIGARMAHDAVRGRSIFFGGIQVSTRFNDTWEWNGINWFSPSPSSVPAVRANHASAYDSLRKRFVLFGGQGDSGQLGDTWEWDGTNWVQLSLATSPAARAQIDMAYDSIRRRIVLFGGNAGSNVNDTWELPSSTAPSVSVRTVPAYPAPGDNVFLVAESSDPDGELPDIRWTQVSGATINLVDAAASSARFTPSTTGLRGFHVALADGNGGYASAVTTVSIENPATLSIDSISTDPVLVSRGQGGVPVQVTVSNTGDRAAAVETLDLSFNGSTSNYTATPSGPALATLAAHSSVTKTFLVSVGAGANLGLTTIDAAITGADGTTGAALSDTSAGITDTWTVQTPAALALRTVSAAPVTVSRGQTVSGVTVTIENTGQATADITTAALTFSASGYTVTPSGSNPVTITGGITRTFTFDVAVGVSATLGAVTLDATVTGSDANSESPVSDTSADTTDTWTVQTPAALSLGTVTATPTTVSRGQTVSGVTLTIANTGQATANMTGASLTFSGSGYTVTPSGSNPVTITGGVTQTFTFDVALGVSATLGATTIDATATATDANSGAVVSDASANVTDTWTVQSPATLFIRSVAATPATVSRGQTVNNVNVVLENTGQATATMGPVTLKFNGSTANYTSTPVIAAPSIAGGTTATFVFDVTVGSGAALGATTLDATATASDANSTAALSDSSADVTDTWTVQAPATLFVRAVSATPAFVSRGQTVSGVTVSVANTGGATANISSVGLTFSGSGYTVTPSGSNPATIAGGVTQTFTFDVAVGTTATLGPTTIDATATGSDANSGAALSDAAADTADSWTVQAPAALFLRTVSATPTFVSRGQTVSGVTLSVANTGGATASVSGISLTFSGSGYTVTPSGSNPVTLTGGVTQTFTFSVAVGNTTTLGATTIDATVSATDVNSGAALSDTSADTTDTWTVQTTATLFVRAVTAAPTTVSRGQTVGGITVSVANTGQATANVSALALKLNGTTNGYTVTPAVTNPSTISGGITATYSFDVTVTSTAPVGATTLDAIATGADANSAAALSDGGADTTDTWTVVGSAVLAVRAVSISPAFVSQGQTVSGVTVTVANTGEATANVSAVALTFSPGTGLLGTRTAGPNTIAGGVTSTYTFNVFAENDATLGLQSVDASASATDANSGLAVSDASADITDSFTVQTRATLFARTVTASPTVVSRGQTVSGLTVSVQNTGQATANVANVGLTFGGTTAGYSISRTGGPASLGGGATGTYTFNVTVTNTANTGPVAIQANASGTDANSAAALSDSLADTPDVWTVQTAASLRIVSIGSVPSPVSRGQTVGGITMTVANSGQAAANVSGASLDFNNAVSGYTVTRTSGPNTISGGGSGAYVFSVAVGSAAPLGATTIDGTVSGTDANSASLATTDDAADTKALWTVQAPGSLQLGTLQAPASISRGQTFSATLPVTNSGGATVHLTSAALTFSDARVTVAARANNPGTVAGGATASLVFDVAAALSATVGTATAQAAVGGRDSNSSAAVGASNAAAASLQVLNVTPTASFTGSSITSVGVAALFDGSGSFDGPTPAQSEGDALRYDWTLVSKPAGSVAAFSRNNSSTPTTSLTPDKKGAYVIGLSVHDGFAFSPVATAPLSIGNTAPVARAGADLSTGYAVPVGLDGSASSDADADTLGYTWRFVAKPAGSGLQDSAILSSLSSRPSFTPDVPGRYELELGVSDGSAASSDRVVVTAANTLPVARLSLPAFATATAAIGLDGSASTDTETGTLAYRWSFSSVPAGSAVTDGSIRVSSASGASFRADLGGTYVVRLVVSDSFDSSLPATAAVQVRNQAPSLVIAPFGSTAFGDTVRLDASGSRDPEGAALSFEWTVLSAPPGSLVSSRSLTPASGTAASRTAFLPDRKGTYDLLLGASDGVLQSIAPTVFVTVVNSAPVASIAAGATAPVASRFVLDGSGSSDRNPGEALVYRWTLLEKPAGSTASTASIRPNDSSTASLAELGLDAPGSYRIELQVADGDGAKGTREVAIQATDSAPIARVSAGTAGAKGQPVLLDASASTDAETPESLIYHWRVVSSPTGTTTASAVLDRNDSQLASRTFFTPPGKGRFVFEVIADDGFLTASARVTVEIANSAPVAAATASASVKAGQTAILDGSASSDADGDALAYQWRVARAPDGSSRSGLVGSGPTLGFVPDVAGIYKLALTVSDGSATSAAFIASLVAAAEDPVVVSLSPARVKSTDASEVDVVGGGFTNFSLVELVGPVSAGSTRLALTATLIDDSRIRAVVPTNRATGSYEIAVTVGGVVSGAPLPKLLVFEPPQVAVKPGQNAMLMFDESYDRDDDTPGIQTQIVLEPVDFEDGAELLLTISEPGDLGSKRKSVLTGVVTGGRVVFPNITMVSGGTYFLEIADALTGEPVAQAVASAGGPPIALLGSNVVNGGGPQVITLDASRSGGAFGPLLYRWRTTLTPPGARSLDSSAPVTTFRARRAGGFALELTVTDTKGRASTAALTFEIANVPPSVNAGPDVQIILPDRLGRVPLEQTTTTLRLDGRATKDPNNSSVTYSWTVLSQPFSSHFVPARDLEEPRSATPTLRFSTDLDTDGALVDAGDYVLLLTVSDPGGLVSTDTVSVRVFDPENLVPDADAGIDRAVSATVLSTSPLALAADIPDPTGQTTSSFIDFVRLDGRESVDPNVPPRPLTYSWRVVSAPERSLVTTLTGSGTAFPGFVPDRPGRYDFELVVHNGRYPSSPDQVTTIVSLAGQNRPPRAEASLQDETGERTSSNSKGLLTFIADVERVLLVGSRSSDPDAGDQITYRWVQEGGPAAELQPSGVQADVSLVPLEPGSYSFRLEVRDSDGVVDVSQSLTFLAVDAADTVPVLSIVSSTATSSATGEDFEPTDTAAQPRSLRVVVGQEVQLTASAIDPDVGVAPLFQQMAIDFTQIAGPTVLLTTQTFSPLLSVARFVPTTSRVHVFEARARQLDAGGAATGVEIARQIRIVVDSAFNGVPEAEASLFPFKNEMSTCTTISLDGSRSRDVGPNASSEVLYRWVQVGGPPVTLSNPFSSVLTFVAPDFADDEPRNYRFQLFVDDGADRSEPDVVSLVVTPESQRFAGMPLASGANLVSVPVDPSLGDKPFRVSDLLRMSGASVGAVLSNGRFRVMHPDLGIQDADVGGSDGFLLLRPAGPERLSSLAGRRWSGQSVYRRLNRGLNLVGYPRGHPADEDAETLRSRSGATFVVGSGGGAFQIYLPGLTPAFPIEEGKAYLLSVPSSRTLTLPGCQ